MSEIDSDHYIGRVVIEYGVESEGEADQFYHEISRTFQNEMQKVMQSVLEELDEPMMRIRIESIDIDLGEFTPSTLTQVFTTTLRERFRKALIDKIGFPGGIKTPQAGTQFSDIIPGRLELVEEFLRTGRVPARAVHMQARAEDLLQDLLRDYTGDTIALIRRLAKTSGVTARRMATQLRPSTVEMIYRALQPNYRNFLLDQELRVATSIAKTLRIPQEHARQEVRHAILNILLQSSRPFTPVALRQELGDEMVRTYGDKVQRLFRDKDAPAQAQQRFTEVTPESEQRALAVVREFMRTGMPASGIPVFVEAWDYLVLYAPQALVEGLGAARGKPEAIVRLMNVLPDSSFEQLIERILPSGHSTIMEVAAAVTGMVASYSNASTAVARLSKSILSALVVYVFDQAKSPNQVSAAGAVEALAKHFSPSRQVPGVIKEALKRQDVPGVSGLKQSPPPADTTASPPSVNWEASAEAAATSAAGGPKWEGGDAPEEVRERERLRRIDREFEAEQEQAAEERLAAVKAEAEELEENFAQQLAEAAEAEGMEPPTALEEPSAEPPQEELPPQLKKIMEERAARTAEIKARIQAEQARVEEVAKEAASRQRDTSGDTPYRAEEAVDPLGTIVSRLDFVEHFFLTGKRPWWLETVPASSLEMAVSSLIKVAGKRLEDRMRSIIFQSRPQQYAEIVDRLVSNLSETHVHAILQLLMPGLAGIMPAITRVLKRFHQEPPRAVNYPPILADQHRFAWHYLVRFAFDYLSSAPGGAALVRYVVENIGKELGEPPRIFLKDFRAIADELIAKGEAPLSTIKNMLPLEGMPLSYAPPTAHPPLEQTIEASEEVKAYIAQMRAAAEAELEADPGSIQERFERRERSKRAYIEAAQARARQKAEEAAAPPKLIYVEGTVIEERISLAAAEKALARAEKRLREAEKLLAAAIDRGDPGPAQERLIVAIEEHRAAAEQVEAVKRAIQADKERRANAPAQDPTTRQPAVQTPAVETPASETPGEETPGAETPATSSPQTAPSAQDQPQQVVKQPKAEEYSYDPSDYVTEPELLAVPVPPEQTERPAADAPTPTLESSQGEDLSPVEQQALREVAAQRLNLPDGAAKALVMYFQTAEALVDLFRHYFQHGSLPGNLPIALPRGQFVLLFDYVMEKYPVEFFAMVRKATASRSARKRLLDLGEPALREAIYALSPRLAGMLLSYMESVQKLADSLSSPIKKENLLEHALAYAARVQSSMFSPLDYMRNLTHYAESELRVEPRRLISWFKSKVEESQSGQNLAIKQVLNVLQNTLLPAEKKKETKERIMRPLNEEIYVTNAGLSLLTPFFSQLFHMNKLLLPDRSNFIDNDARNRAIHLMQYVVTKEMDAPEEKLTLNKLFVGMPLDEPVVASIEMSQEEIDIIDSMLVAAAKRWSAIKNENPEFLRAQFLDREGKIKRRGEGWDVFVSQKPYDVLLGKLPWSMNPVKLPWLEYKIEIFWR